MKFSGNVLNGTRNKCLNFGSDLGYCLDHLDPGFFGWILMIVQELGSLGRGLRSLSAVVVYGFTTK